MLGSDDVFSESILLRETCRELLHLFEKRKFNISQDKAPDVKTLSGVYFRGVLFSGQVSKATN